MKKIIKRKIYLNIILLLFWIALAFLNFKENKGHFINLFYLTILFEISYWLTILIGIYLNKRLKKKSYEFLYFINGVCS